MAARFVAEYLKTYGLQGTREPHRAGQDPRRRARGLRERRLDFKAVGHRTPRRRTDRPARGPSTSSGAQLPVDTAIVSRASALIDAPARAPLGDRGVRLPTTVGAAPDGQASTRDPMGNNRFSTSPEANAHPLAHQRTPRFPLPSGERDVRP